MSQKISTIQTPASQGFVFPAEWAKHTATWLSWPHKEASWPGKIDLIYPAYIKFIKVLTKGELVRINVLDENMKASVAFQLQNAGVDMSKIELFEFATNERKVPELVERVANLRRGLLQCGVECGNRLALGTQSGLDLGEQCFQFADARSKCGHFVRRCRLVRVEGR